MAGRPSDNDLSPTTDREYVADVISGLTDVISEEPNDGRVYLLRGNAYLDSGRFAAAVSDYARAIELDADNPTLHNNRGIAHRSLRDPDAAIADYDTALRLDPHYRDAYTNRGIAYADKGDLTRAIIDFSVAIDLDPESWHAFGQRGSALWELDRQAEAEQDYARASQIVRAQGRRYWQAI